MRRIVAGRVALCAVSVSILACGGESLPPELAGESQCSELRVESVLAKGNLILVLNDTMRRDFVGVYGGAARTPHFDTFASENLIFDSALSQAPWTKPSIATLFTSLYPSQHRLESHPGLRRGSTATDHDGVEKADILAPSLATLAEVLHESGMRTAAFISNPWMASGFGFDQGFEIYDDSFARWGAPGATVIDAGLAWIETLKEGERFFLYLHTIDSHRPYGRIPADAHEVLRRRFNTGPELVSKSDRAFAAQIRIDDGTRAGEIGLAPTSGLIRAAYRSGIEDFDAVLGRLLGALRGDQAIWKSTAIIITSDHGESLFDRGVGNHGHSLLDDEVAIPLVARLPGVVPERARVGCLVGLVDLLPSLCSYLDVSCPSNLQGWSFLPHEGEDLSDETRYLVSEGAMNTPDHRSIRNRRFKLTFEPQQESDAARDESSYALYDLEADPHEYFNRLATAPRSPGVDRAFGTLRDALPESVAELPVHESSTAEIDSELQERLEALGYAE